MGPNPIWLVSFIRRLGHRHIQMEDHVKIQRENTTYEPSRKASEGINPANTLLLDFWTSEQWGNKFLLSKTPSLWYFVMAALTNYYKQHVDKGKKMDFCCIAAYSEMTLKGSYEGQYSRWTVLSYAPGHTVCVKREVSCVYFNSWEMWNGLPGRWPDAFNFRLCRFRSFGFQKVHF